MKFVFIVLLVSSGFFLKAQPSLSEPIDLPLSLSEVLSDSCAWYTVAHKLDSFYNKRVSGGFNGQVLVGYKGNIIYERYFGYADKAVERKLTAHTPSQLASTSKPITALAIGILKDRGLLSFDDSVAKYIPNFPYADITIRHLLTHRSGLPEYFGMAMGAKLDSAETLMSNDSLISLLIERKPRLTNQVDTRFRYRNTNYAILSYLVSSLSKMSFASFVHENIFNPLGMADSYIYDNTAPQIENMSLSYKGAWIPQKQMRLDGITGDKGCYSTVQDLYKLDQALYQNKLVEKSTLDEMYAAHSFERAGYQSYGLGWRMFNYPHQKIVFHNGNWHANNNCFYRFIDENFTIIILGNKANKYIYAHPQAIYKLITNKNLRPSEEDDF